MTEEIKKKRGRPITPDAKRDVVSVRLSKESKIQLAYLMGKFGEGPQQTFLRTLERVYSHENFKEAEWK